ncbi:MAG: NUDIX domain-containing protein [Lentisphaerae bacterium]|nr:NUDIX domain-containing protein [Lentisphaerota bacterium]MBQ4329264.1 NUDIX domain-containing protein [Lentisphaeria bacterium]
MIDVAAAVIIENGKVFISSRPADKPPAGWEFPGGKLEPGETAADAVKRELMEELGLSIIPAEELYTLCREHLRITFISCSIAENASLPYARENQEFKWVSLTPAPPEGLLKNDIEFWNFLIRHKIKTLNSPL